MGYSLAQDSQHWYFQHPCRILVLPWCCRRSRDSRKRRTGLLWQGGASSFFSLSTSELKRSFERASDTKTLQKLLELELISCEFFSTALRAKPDRAQGCLLNFFLTAHLGLGAAAEHFVSLLWAKWCSGSCVSHPSPAVWLCHPISSTAAPAPGAVCSSWMWPLSLAEPSLVPCLQG